MRENVEASLRVRSRPRSGLFAALPLAVAVCVLSAECKAAEATSSAPANGVSTLLAAASENILSESAMAEQKGSGFRPPNIFANEANGPPKVTLWDEMKTSPILNPAQDGIVTGGISGR